MLNMKVISNEESNGGNTESPVKQKAGHRLQAAILRNIHHERKLKMECEALQKARKTVEHDIRQIEQKLQRAQRYPTSQEHSAKTSASGQLNGKKLVLDRAHPSSRAEQTPSKVRALPGGVAQSRNTDGDSRLSVKFKEDSKTFPAYEQRFLNMLDGSQVEKSGVESANSTPKMERRSLFFRTLSNGQNEPDDCVPKERGIDGSKWEAISPSESEMALGNTETIGERHKLLHDEKHTEGVAGYSRHLVKMDHIVKRRQSGPDETERAISESLGHLSGSNLSGTDTIYEKPRLTKYQEPISVTSALKQEWRDNEKRNSQPISGERISTVSSHLNVNKTNVHGVEDSLGSFKMPKKPSISKGDLKRLSLNGVSANSIVEYRLKISKPTISKAGDEYDQTGCFITNLRKTDGNF